MSHDPRSRIFKPLGEFERSLDQLDPMEARKAKIAFVADGISLYKDEENWQQKCVPPYWLLCLIPPLWPVLWYRNGLSKMTLLAIASAINRCRKSWEDDLRNSGLSFDGIPSV